jgi:plastocyanin
MDGGFYFVFGIVLVIAAVGLAFLGIRDSERFPASRGVLVGVTALFAAVVVTTMSFAVVNARHEQKDRDEELAKEEEQAKEEAAPGGQPSGGAVETLDVSSPADGGLVFQPDGLEAKPGNLTINYDNPSPVPHSIAVATANGNVLGETQPAAGGTQTLQVPNLAPGKFIFYCTVPGHREAGMEGNLTVTGGPTP